MRGYAAAGFPTPTFRSALATVLGIDPRYVTVIAVADQPARRAAEAPTVLIGSVVAAVSAATAERLAATVRVAALALTAELRRLGLVEAQVTSLTATVQSPASTPPTPVDAAADMRFGGLGALELGLIVGLCCLLLFAAVMCLCCCSRSQSPKVAPGQPFGAAAQSVTQPPTTAATQDAASNGGGSCGGVREDAELERSAMFGSEAAVAAASAVEATSGAGDAAGEVGGEATRRQSSSFPVLQVRNDSSSRASPNDRAALPPVRPPASWTDGEVAGVIRRSPA